MKLEKSKLNIISIIYMYIGIFIFFIGYLKVIYSIPLCLALLYILIKYIKNERIKKDKEEIYINKYILLIVMILLWVWCIVSGIGNFFSQHFDWKVRNSILKDLINFSWPVVYSDNSALSYYVGQWMLPAIIGKIFNSFNIANIVLLLYSYIGILLVYFYLILITNSNTKLKCIITVIVFIFWERLILLKYIIGTFIDIGMGIMIQFQGNSLHLSWTFNQVIVPWIITCMFLTNRKKVNYFGLIAFPVILYAPYALVGIAIIMIYDVIINLIKKIKDKEFKQYIKTIFSLENIISFICIIPIISLYYFGNVIAEKPSELLFSFINYTGKIHIYLIICLTEFLIYSLLIFNKYKKERLFYIINIILFVLLLFKHGLYNDLQMRVSIAPLFILMIFVIKFLYYKKENINKFKKCYNIFIKIILIICLLIGIVSVVLYNYQDVFLITILYGVKLEDEYNSLLNLKYSGPIDLQYNYYTENYKNDIFYKYFAKTLN